MDIPRPKSYTPIIPRIIWFRIESIYDKGDRIKNTCLAMCKDGLQADY
jgi:hypothetical protein